MNCLSRIYLIFLLFSIFFFPLHSNSQTAEEHHEKGLSLYNKGKYKEAIEEFEKSNAISPNPSNIFNMARAYEKLGQFAKAVELYKQYINDPKAEKKEKAKTYLESIQSTKSKVKVTSNPEGAEIYLDDSKEPAGKTPAEIEVYPGSHKFSVHLEGYKDQERQLETGFNERYEINFLLLKKEVPIPAPAPPTTEKEQPKPVEKTPPKQAEEKLKQVQLQKKKVIPSKKEPREQSNFIAISAGISFPIHWNEIGRFMQNSILYERKLKRIPIFCGMEIQYSWNSQIFSLVIGSGYEFFLPKNFYIYAIFGLGFGILRISEEGLAYEKGAGWDIVLKPDIGFGWSSRFGLNIVFAIGDFSFYPGAGNIESGFSVQWNPALRIGWRF